MQRDGRSIQEHEPKSKITITTITNIKCHCSP